MDYASYRRVGLPITSSHIESAVKELSTGSKAVRNSGASLAASQCFN